MTDMGFVCTSFQFETEIEGGKLRRDVLAEGSVSSGGAPAGIVSMLSGQEELFAFRRAVSGIFLSSITQIDCRGSPFFAFIFKLKINEEIKGKQKSFRI